MSGEYLERGLTDAAPTPSIVRPASDEVAA
jgi:hypothetical protein